MPRRDHPEFYHIHRPLPSKMNGALEGMGIECSRLNCGDKPDINKNGCKQMKIVLLGKAYGGKTCLFNRFLLEKFHGENKPYQATIGAAFGSKTVVLDEATSVAMAIWDTGGCERFEAISRLYYRGAQAALLCYDVTDRNSFERVQFWFNELMEHEPNCALYLCGTKKDLLGEPFLRHRQMSPKELMEYATRIFAAGSFETSSKTGEGVYELFQIIAADYVRTLEDNCVHYHEHDQTDRGKVKLHHDKETCADHIHHKCHACG